MSEENKEETPVTQTIEQVEEKEPDHMEQTVGEHLDDAYEKSTSVDAEKLNKSLKRVMRTLPLEHLSGAMSSYVAFMNLFVKKNLAKLGINVGGTDEQFENDLHKSVRGMKRLTRILHESMLDPETQIVARELMLKTVDMTREFMKVLSTALLEQGASLVLDNGDKIAGIAGKSIEGVGRAFVDGTLNSFSAVPFLGNFFSVLRTIHSLVLPMFTIGGGTLQLGMTAISAMYRVLEKLRVPGLKALDSMFGTFEKTRQLGDHVLADVRDGFELDPSKAEGIPKEELPDPIEIKQSDTSTPLPAETPPPPPAETPPSPPAETPPSPPAETPPAAEEKKEETPPATEEKKEETPPATEEKPPAIEEKKEEIPPAEEKKEEIPPAEEKKEETPPATEEKKEEIPGAEEKKEEIPGAEEKKEETPPAAEEKKEESNKESEPEKKDEENKETTSEEKKTDMGEKKTDTPAQSGGGKRKKKSSKKRTKKKTPKRKRKNKSKKNKKKGNNIRLILREIYG